jgi:AcrR family transcriptional regulator
MTGGDIAQSGALSLSAGRHRLNVADIQRTRILAATIDVCAERGAAGVTVVEVVERACLSRRTFYELFRDVSECMVAAFDHCVQTAAERVLPAYGPSVRTLKGTGWRERVRAGLVATLAFLDEEPAMARVLLVESLAAGPEIVARRARVVAQLAGALEAGREEAGGRAAGLPDLLGEWTAGAALSILRTRLAAARKGKLFSLAPQLMSLIVLPYLGPAAARAELERPVQALLSVHTGNGKPLRDLNLRVTYRTMRVLIAVAEHPGSSNRQVGCLAGADDQGQISKLLARLQQRGLVENVRSLDLHGAPNAWQLTADGRQLHRLLVRQAGPRG